MTALWCKNLVELQVEHLRSMICQSLVLETDKSLNEGVLPEVLQGSYTTKQSQGYFFLFISCWWQFYNQNMEIQLKRTILNPTSHTKLILYPVFQIVLITHWQASYTLQHTKNEVYNLQQSNQNDNKLLYTQQHCNNYLEKVCSVTKCCFDCIKNIFLPAILGAFMITIRYSCLCKCQ